MSSSGSAYVSVCCIHILKIRRWPFMTPELANGKLSCLAQAYNVSWWVGRMSQGLVLAWDYEELGEPCLGVGTLVFSHLGIISGLWSRGVRCISVFYFTLPFYCSIIALLYCVSFCCSAKWTSYIYIYTYIYTHTHTYTYIPSCFEFPSHLGKLWAFRALSRVPWAIQQVLISYIFYI